MYARVVRFTDIKPEQIEEVKGRAGSEGPPPGVAAKEIKMVLDQDQGTAVVVLFFDTQEDMRQADSALNEMGASETPGTRASVDQGEVTLDVTPG